MRYFYCFKIPAALILSLCLFIKTGGAQQSAAKTGEPQKGTTWISDNGNGTFTNPLFYDEFSDPDLIRVGSLSSADAPVPCPTGKTARVFHG
ncbi:hypothetical protein ACEN9X_06315 [Mucilaginibacter sp. Mucisp86]|uniref:hypothetical protein n=1 Tax=Mucilaginibacter sp. Mucisp86 TaxID=3243060 RepID=UPI0039B5BF58